MKADCKNNELPESVLKQCKELGFKGKPVVVEKYVNKLRQPVGLRDHDIDAGNVAYKVGDKLIISPAIGKAYFECNFVKVNQ